ncbi:putative hydrogenase component [Cylindrospermum sp. NIES-4074]|nr:putative hydrogenase component [Cylindrospermum sp. NIES-4074]
MPQVLAQGKTIECHRQANLRKILLQNGVDLYNGGAKVINCRGIGSCGTCAVKVEGEVSAVNWRDKTRRSRSVRSSAFASSSFSYNRPAFSLSN